MSIGKIEWIKWSPDMDTKEVTMIQDIEDLITFEHNEELKQFAEYLGVDYEDYLEFLHPDVDFDDVSR